MIKTTADLLKAIMDSEALKLSEENITHRVTIGNMHEGLTADLINKAVFNGLGLSVVNNSFIKRADGLLSKEMDIMLILGEGEAIPYTKQFKVQAEKVIAVIQVKKKLNKQQLQDAYLNLKDVYDSAEWDQVDDYQKLMYRESFINICKKDILDNGQLRTSFENETERQLFHMLLFEATMPIRIVLGYEGYASEHGLRKGFLEYLSDNQSTPGDLKAGFSPLIFPNLIINGSCSLLKGNAMPYVGPMIKNRWAFYFSNTTNPWMHFLEMVWTRLSYMFNLSAEIFGEDLELEGLNTLLVGNTTEYQGLSGWNYDIIDTPKEELEATTQNIQWSPLKLSKEQNEVFRHLMTYGTLAKAELPSLVQIGEDEIGSFIELLLQTNMIIVNSIGIIRLSTKSCRIYEDPEEGYLAADDKSGRFTRWLKKRIGQIANDNQKKTDL